MVEICIARRERNCFECGSPKLVFTKAFHWNWLLEHALPQPCEHCFRSRSPTAWGHKASWHARVLFVIRINPTSLSIKWRSAMHHYSQVKKDHFVVRVRAGWGFLCLDRHVTNVSLKWACVLYFVVYHASVMSHPVTMAAMVELKRSVLYWTIRTQYFGLNFVIKQHFIPLFEWVLYMYFLLFTRETV